MKIQIVKRYLLGSKKLRFGPGGIHCNCCCKFKFRGRKRLMNRMARRTIRSKNEVDEQLNDYYYNDNDEYYYLGELGE